MPFGGGYCHNLQSRRKIHTAKQGCIYGDVSRPVEKVAPKKRVFKGRRGTRKNIVKRRDSVKCQEAGCSV
jgi:hypothetical protein